MANAYILRINDTWANILADPLDNAKTAIITDAIGATVKREHVHKIDGNFMFPAMSKYTADGAAWTYMDADFNSVKVLESEDNNGLQIADYLFHVDDTDTYMRFPAPDQILFVAGNVSMMNFVEGATDYIEANTNSVDVDFIINGNGQASLFRCDAGNNRVGFLTAAPEAPIHVFGGDSSNAPDADVFVFIEQASDNAYLEFSVEDGYYSGIRFSNSGDNAHPGIIRQYNKVEGNGEYLAFCNNSTYIDRMKLFSSILEFSNDDDFEITVETDGSDAGHNLTVSAGDAGGGDTNGGTLYLNGGALSGEGGNGYVYIGQSNTSNCYCDVTFHVENIFARDGDGLSLKDDAGNLGVFVEDGGNVGIKTDSPAATLHVLGTGQEVLRIESTYSTDGSAAPILNLLRTDTGADNDYVGQLSFTGYDDNDVLITWCRITPQIVDASTGDTDSKLEFYLKDSESSNLAVWFNGDGQIHADLGGGAGNVTVFDKYDDAKELDTIVRKQVFDRGVKMGIFEKKDTGSGYSMNFQKFMFLLAGGIYQSRKKINKIEKRLALANI